jgi:hypothetical protein
MALHDAHSAAHTAEHEGAIYHHVASNNTSSNTSDSSYYKHNNNNNEQDAAAAGRGTNNVGLYDWYSDGGEDDLSTFVAENDSPYA